MNQFNSTLTPQQEISQILQSSQIELFGLANLKTPVSLDIYRDWLNKGLNGEMSYLERHFEQKEDPTRLLPKAKTAIVMAFQYWPHPRANLPFRNLKIAKYAQGEDYHNWVKLKLQEVERKLKQKFSEHDFYCATDSSPVLERELAYFAGLGWFGKNSCIINQKRGSYFFIGEIYTTIPLQIETQVPHDMCGTCNRCIEACPTEAILPNKTINSNLCISYLTIESKKNPPENLRSKIGSHFFGCDICQDVCPWNQKLVPGPLTLAKESDNKDLIEELRMVLSLSNQRLQEVLCNTPLIRARPYGLKRNALIVIGNQKLSELRAEVAAYVEHDRLSELALWTLRQL